MNKVYLIKVILLFSTTISVIKMEDNLSMPLFENGRYNNPWSTWQEVFLNPVNLVYYKFTKDLKNIPDQNTLDRTLPIHRITDQEIKSFCEEDTKDKIKVIWIGHSTSLINIENTIILTDPVFYRDSRYRDVPITIDRIPRVDAVVISHNHYDHLDQPSILDLYNKFGNKGISWFCGMGTKQWFNSIGINENVHELNWWQSKKIKNIEFVFTPAQHWSMRKVFDKNKALWGSWVIVGAQKKIFFAGDTGYCTAFTEIGNKYGPFDLSFIPIGAYHPRWFLSPQHVDPEQAVQIHVDVKSKKSLAIHWGTFPMGKEFYLAPKEELQSTLDKLSLDKQSFITLRHGEINSL